MDRVWPFNKRPRSPDPDEQNNEHGSNKRARTSSSSLGPEPEIDSAAAERHDLPEEGEIAEEEQPVKKKKKKLAPRGGKQWAKKHPRQAADRAARKAAREAAAAGPAPTQTTPDPADHGGEAPGVDPTTSDADQDSRSPPVSGVDNTPSHEDFRRLRSEFEAFRAGFKAGRQEVLEGDVVKAEVAEMKLKMEQLEQHLMCPD